MTDYKCTIKFTMDDSMYVGTVIDTCKDILEYIDGKHGTDNIRWTVG